MMPWIVITGICLFLDIFYILFSIAFNPTIANIISSTSSWALLLYFFLVVCAFKAEMEEETLPYPDVVPAAASSAPPTGFLDLENLKREWKTKRGSSGNINYRQFH